MISLLIVVCVGCVLNGERKSWRYIRISPCTRVCVLCDLVGISAFPLTVRTVLGICVTHNVDTAMCTYCTGRT